MMIQSILSNLSIILLGHLVMSTLMNYKERFTKNQIFMFIILLFSSVIIILFYLPIQFGEYFFDLRLIPLIFLALFRGWKVALSVLIIVSIWRFFMGGDGAMPGILFGMVLPTLLTLIIRKVKSKQVNNIEILLIITICWFISDFPIIFIIPNGLEIFEDIWMIRYLSFIGTASIHYIFILLAHKNEELKNQLEFSAKHDALTKLLNKNSFIEKVEKELQQSNSEQSIAMVDIDFFKPINDTYGHVAGDQVLIQLSAIFNQFQNENVIIGRYGGEEFIIFQKGTIEEAIKKLEEIQNEIRRYSFQLNANDRVNITVSIGIARLETDLVQSIKQADKNLYIAKKRGRDRFIYTDDTFNRF